MTLALQQDNRITYISEIARYLANTKFVEPKSDYKASDILDMIRATKTNVDQIEKQQDVSELRQELTSVLKGYATRLENKSELDEVISLISKYNKDLLQFIETSRKECIPCGIKYITFNIEVTNSANNLKVLVSQHKSRLLRTVDALEPIEFTPKKTTVVLKVVGDKGLEQNNIVVFRTNKYEKALAYVVTLVLCVGIIGGTSVIMKGIDKAQNARIATEQIQDVEVLSNDELINKWVTDFENCEIDFGTTIHPDYFVSNVDYFNKVMEEVVEHTENIQVEKTKEGYKVEADIKPVSQYSAIINAPLVRPDISEIKENLKSGSYSDEDIMVQLDGVKYKLFSDFCFIDVPDAEGSHIESILTVEDGKVKGSLDFIDKVLDVSGIRNNIGVFDTEIGEYMFNLTTDSGKEAK